MAPTRDNALMFLICWRIIKSIVCKVHCYKHLLADECKEHAQLTQENEIRCQAETGKDLHPLVFRSLLDLQAAVLRLNKVRSSAHWLTDWLRAGPACTTRLGWLLAGQGTLGDSTDSEEEKLEEKDCVDQWPLTSSHFGAGTEVDIIMDRQIYLVKFLRFLSWYIVVTQK